MNYLSALNAAAAKAFKDYLKVRDNENVLLIFDDSTEEIAKAFEASASELEISLTTQKIEFTGVHGENPDDKTCSMMREHAVIIAPSRFSLTHCQAMTEARKAGARVATLPGINADMFARGLTIDPEKLKRDGERWIKAMSGKHAVRIKTETGTDMEFSIGQYPVINDDGCIWEPGKGGNLPAGEVFVAPDLGTANGTVAIDGSIGCFDWQPDDEPAVVTLKNGSAVSFEGKRGKALGQMLAAHGDKGFVLAEFGIGTNPQLRLCGDLLEDEKVKGTIHLAFGNNCGFGGDNDVPVHIDGLVLAPDVIVDRAELMKKGKWLI